MWWVGWRVGRGEGGGVGICMHAMSFVFGHETARGGWYTGFVAASAKAPCGAERLIAENITCTEICQLC